MGSYATVYVLSVVSTTAEGEFVAEKLGCRFVETSAKLGVNVTETFIDLVCEIRDRNKVGYLFFILYDGGHDDDPQFICIRTGVAADASRPTACHPRQQHPVARCRLLEQCWLHSFLTCTLPRIITT